MSGYQPNIPQSTDYISRSQRQMRSNFNSINEVWGKLPTSVENDGDHVPLIADEADERGMHKAVTLLNASVAPVSAANEGILYEQSNKLIWLGEPAATAYDIVRENQINQNGLGLAAFVKFACGGDPANGAVMPIIEYNTVVNGETVKVPMAMNVTEVRAYRPTANTDRYYEVTFTTALPNSDYFWVIDSKRTIAGAGNLATPFALVARGGSTYGESISTTHFRISFYSRSDSGGSTQKAMQAATQSCMLQIYRVLT